MASLALSSERPSWTWADLVSTYRFWGLLLIFVFSGLACNSLAVSMPALLRDQYGLSNVHMASVLASRFWMVPLAFYLAWAAIRSKPVPVLLTLGGLQVLMAAFLVWVRPESHQAIVLSVEFGCMYLADYVVQLVAPAVIANAMGGGEVFFLAFGVMFLFRQLLGAVSGVLFGAIAQSVGSTSSTLYTVPVLVAALVGLICLLPVRHVLFAVPPPARGRALQPVRRGPAVTALLSALVPFYFVYWLYRVHGEAAHLEPSRRLLSPRAAAWSVLGIPEPIVLATLADHLNQTAAARGMPRIRRVWGIILWSIFFMPAAIGLLQAALNRLSAHRQSLADNQAPA